MALVCRLVARRVRAVNEQLTRASQAHDKELSDDAAPRAARDEAAATLTAEVVDIRVVIGRIYGPETLLRLGLHGKTPVEPKAILETAKSLAGYLGDSAFAWPKPRRKGMTMVPSEWLADLQKPIADLDAALKDVAWEAREEQATGALKSHAMEANDEVFTRSATFLSSTFVLLGHDALAGKVRPSKRRPGLVEPKPEEEATLPAK